MRAWWRRCCYSVFRKEYNNDSLFKVPERAMMEQLNPKPSLPETTHMKTALPWLACQSSPGSRSRPRNGVFYGRQLFVPSPCRVIAPAFLVGGFSELASVTWYVLNKCWFFSLSFLFISLPLTISDGAFNSLYSSQSVAHNFKVNIMKVI